MRKNLSAQMDQAIQQVFEGLLFLEANPQDISREPSTLVLEASLEIQGPVGGVLALQVSHDDSRRLLKALPSPSNLPEQEAVIDLFAELANTVGGRFAAAFAGDESFDLSIPAVRFGRFPCDRTAIFRVYTLDDVQLFVFFRPTSHQGEKRAY